MRTGDEPAGVEYVDHAADVGIRARAESVDGVFERAAAGLFALMVRLADVQPLVRRPVRCSAETRSALLVEWLGALLAERDVAGLVFGRFEVAIEETGQGVSLHGAAWGEPFDASRHDPGIEVKGISYLGLDVSEQADGEWIAACVVDV